jgi:hypothetical protein
MNIPYIHERNGGRGLHLHMTLGRGDAYYVEDAGIRRSDALNVVKKTKGPTQQTSILIYDEILDDLPAERQREFTPIRTERTMRRVYGYFPAMRKALRTLIAEHERADQMMEAAHCAYRLAALNVAVGNRDDAISTFDRCIRLVDAVNPQTRHRYFVSTLSSFYTAWRDFIRDGPSELFAGRCDDRRELLLTRAAQDFFSAPGRGGMGNVLAHVECIIEQLDILAEKVVNDPTGLTTIEVCQLLQRCGYSPKYENHAIHHRLNRIHAEMQENHQRSLDGDCSICSGAAASCLIIAGDHEHASELLDWLRLQKPSKYCCLVTSYTDAKPAEHALHYAAMVFCAFIDCALDDAARKDDVDSVKEELLPKNWRAADDSLPEHWMKYRNITEFEVCAYILPSLLRYGLSGGGFNDEERENLHKVLVALARAVLSESERAQCPSAPGRYYGGRENVGSFALGLVDGIGLPKEAVQIVAHALTLFDKRARRHEGWTTIREQTMDSNVDRLRKMLNGWLSQWEVILRITDRSSLPDYALGMLTHYDWAERERMRFRPTPPA